MPPMMYPRDPSACPAFVSCEKDLLIAIELVAFFAIQQYAAWLNGPDGILNIITSITKFIPLQSAHQTKFTTSRRI